MVDTFVWLLKIKKHKVIFFSFFPLQKKFYCLLLSGLNFATCLRDLEIMFSAPRYHTSTWCTEHARMGRQGGSSQPACQTYFICRNKEIIVVSQQRCLITEYPTSMPNNLFYSSFYFTGYGRTVYPMYGEFLGMETRH